MLNTAWVRQQAGCELLGELFAGTCKYLPHETGAYDSPIEPDQPALIEFRKILAELAGLHSIGELSEEVVRGAKKFVRNTGSKYGHVTSAYTTGTWGVRLSELGTLVELLNVPDYCLPRIGSLIPIYEELWAIKEYRVSTNWLFIKIENDHASFEVNKSWNELANPAWVTEAW